MFPSGSSFKSELSQSSKKLLRCEDLDLVNWHHRELQWDHWLSHACSVLSSPLTHEKDMRIGRKRVFMASPPLAWHPSMSQGEGHQPPSMASPNLIKDAWQWSLMDTLWFLSTAYIEFAAENAKKILRTPQPLPPLGHTSL